MTKSALGLAAAFVVAALGVFAVPWVVPVDIQPVVSVSQGVGFSNRAAVIGLVLAALLAFATADWHSRVRPYLRLRKEGDHLDPRLVWGLAGATAVVTAAVAVSLKSYPHNEAAYFLDRLAYVTNGNIPYVQFEFSYGPAMLYVPWAVIKVLGLVGVSPAAGYFATLVATRVVGLVMVAWLLDRLDGPRWLRTAMLVVFAVWGVAQLGMGLEYAFPRYAIGPVLLVVIFEHLEDLGPWRLAAASCGAVIVGALVSPEVGVALLAALGTAFAFLVWRKVGGIIPALGALVALGAATAVALSFASTFVAFIGGTLYFPVIPGPPALVYVAAVLVVAAATGTGMLRIKPRFAAGQIGWIVIAVVLAAAALGRADFGHIFWNGLPVLLAAPFVLHRAAPRYGIAAFALVAVVFLATLFVFETQVEGPGFLARVVAAGTLTPQQALSIGGALGTPTDRLDKLLQRGSLAALTPEQRAEMAKLDGVVAPFTFDSPAQWDLADARRLAPLWSTVRWSTWNDAQRSMADIRKARYVVVPNADWVGMQASPATKAPADQPLMVKPAHYTDSVVYGAIYGVPGFQFTVRNPILDEAANSVALLTQTRVLDRTIGPYAILKKR